MIDPLSNPKLAFPDYIVESYLDHNSEVFTKK